VRLKPILLPLAAVLLLANPLDCFSQLAGEQPSSCCASRHCKPVNQSRTCCKVTLFQYAQYFETAPKAPLPAPDVTAAPVAPVQHFDLTVTVALLEPDVNEHAPPGAYSHSSLPLLI